MCKLIVLEIVLGLPLVIVLHKSQVSDMFSKVALGELVLTVPYDFLILSAKAMQQLKSSGRSNVMYKLAKSIRTVHRDGTDSFFPLKRIPMGMLEYMADFY